MAAAAAAVAEAEKSAEATEAAFSGGTRVGSTQPGWEPSEKG